MTTLEHDDIILNHLPLAENLALKRSKIIPRIYLEELISAAYLGLVQAAYTFDSSVGAPFIAHAKTRILGAIKDYLRELQWGSRNAPLKASSSNMEEISNSTVDSFSELLDGLDSQAREIIELYYKGGFTQREIGSKMGLNGSRISQIMSRSNKILAKVL